MRALIIRKRFDRDLKLARKRRKDIGKLHKIVDDLQTNKPLEARHRPHALGGEWHGCHECHVEPDWLLIYQLIDNDLVLVRTGSHSDLFD